MYDKHTHTQRSTVAHCGGRSRKTLLHRDTLEQKAVKERRAKASVGERRERERSVGERRGVN